jgi:hypothetical protein
MGEGRDLQVYKVSNVKLVQVFASSSLKFLKSINFNLCPSAGRFIPSHFSFLTCHARHAISLIVDGQRDEIDNFQKVQGKK